MNNNSTILSGLWGLGFHPAHSHGSCFTLFMEAICIRCSQRQIMGYGSQQQLIKYRTCHLRNSGGCLKVSSDTGSSSFLFWATFMFTEELLHLQTPNPQRRKSNVIRIKARVRRFSSCAFIP